MTFLDLQFKLVLKKNRFKVVIIVSFSGILFIRRQTSERLTQAITAPWIFLHQKAIYTFYFNSLAVTALSGVKANTNMQALLRRGSKGRFWAS